MNDKYTRTTVEIETENYKKLKVKLIMEDKKLNEWINEKVAQEVDQTTSEKQ